MRKKRVFVGILIITLLLQLAVVPALAASSSETEDAPKTLSVRNGFGQGSDGSWYYYENGKIDADRNDVIKDEDKRIDGTDGWWYVVGGKVQTDFTGLADYRNANGWWYIKNGKVDFTHNGVEKNKNGWWYVVDGKVRFGFTGLANYRNANGWWYIKDGKVDFTHDGVDKNKNGWWYVTDGKVRFGYTGLANYRNDSGWWYINGGKVDFSYNGFGKNKNGSWYLESGKVRFDKNSVIKDTTGALGTKGTWYYVVGSKVQTNFTGLADYKNANGWWYIKNGKVDFTHTGVEKNKNGWWYVTGGKVDFSFNGIAKNSNGWWYIRDGKVNFSYSGSIQVAGETYNVVGGKVQDVNLPSGTVAQSSDASENYEIAAADIKYGGTDTNQLAAPQFTGSVSTSSGMTLTWNAVSGAEKYRVFRRVYGGSWEKLTDTTKTTYTDYLWTDDTLYQYTVRCVNAAGTAYTSPYIKGYAGTAIAGYAQLFVGNPYVYGGISLTDGCDCSGFVLQVYAHFGYYMPHYSGTQITLGKEVSYANAQPGDIIGRTGHTTIYIGDGKLVQAKGAAYGIVISNVSDVQYSAVRRYL